MGRYFKPESEPEGMKQALAALEVRVLAGEMAFMEGAKIDQVYELAEGDLLLQLHMRGVGKEIVSLRPPMALYGKAIKPVQEGQKLSGFCMLLRQKVSYKRILRQYQHGFDRIWVVELGHEAPELYLISEFFGKGNIVLADDKMTVLGALEERSFGVRSTKRQATYQFPKSPVDPFAIDGEQFERIVRGSGKDQLVKALALDLSLGGLYAEELCSRVGLDKAATPASLSSVDCHRLQEDLGGLSGRPQVVFKDFAPHDVVVGDLAAYSGFERQLVASFSEAQAVFWSLYAPPKKLSSRRQKLETMIADQKRHLEAQLAVYQSAQKRGEALYLHYPQVKELLELIRAGAKAMGWAQAKERYADHPLVRSIDDKNGIVEIELPD